MTLLHQKRIAAQLLKVGMTRIWFDPDHLDDIKEAITKTDVRSLINQGIIQKKPSVGISRGRNRKRLEQKRKGRRQGSGSRKGRKTARLPRKRLWILKIRTQRELLATLRKKKVLDPQGYRELYVKSKGGFFRSKRHIHLYIKEHNLERKHEK